MSEKHGPIEEMLVSLVRSGVSPADISVQTGIKEDTVRSMLRRMGISSSEWKRCRDDAIVSAYKSGMFIKDIAKSAGVCCSTVMSVLAIRRIPKRTLHRGLRPNPMSAAGVEALRLIDEGATNAEAGRASGLSRERVRQLRHKYRRCTP